MCEYIYARGITAIHIVANGIPKLHVNVTVHCHLRKKEVFTCIIAITTVFTLLRYLNNLQNSSPYSNNRKENVPLKLGRINRLSSLRRINMSCCLSFIYSAALLLLIILNCSVAGIKPLNTGVNIDS